MVLFRDYDQVGLDAQYNNGQRHPDMSDYIERWEAESAAAHTGCPAVLDLAYGDHPRQRLDIFNGPGAGAPTLVFIHGGYWQRLDKSSHSFPAPAITAAGINYVAISYPLAPEVPIATIIASARRAMAWLWQNGANHGLNVDRLYLCGHSAGGHLTATTMATDWSALDSRLPGDLVKAGCGISGLYEMEPIRLSYLNDVLAIGPDDIPHISPDHNLGRSRLNLAVGGAETDEFIRQTADFHATWAAGGGSGDHLVADGKNHFSIIDGLADPASDLFALLSQMVGVA